MDHAEALATIELLRGHIAALETLLAERDAALAAARYELQLKGFEIARLKRALFGDRKERVLPEELMLPGLDLTTRNDNAGAAPPEEASEKRKVREHEREVVSRKRRARLELEPGCFDERHDVIAPATTTCACCGGEMTPMGEETRKRVERIPARYLLIYTHRPQFACNHCKLGGVQIAPAEDPPAIGAGTVGQSLGVDIAVMHYADHLPFHRMAGIFGREGLHIDRATLSRVAARVSEALRPVVDAMQEELLGSDCVLGIDGTGVKILARRRCLRRTAYVLHGLGHVVFRALKAGTADDVLEGFVDFRGVVVSDAAKVHTGKKSEALGLLVSLCNAHGRRHFFDARETDPARVNHALAFYQEVAHAERRWRELDATARQRERERELGPRFEAFRAWLLEERPKLLARSPLAQAFDYALGHWEGLTRFLRDGRLPWTNNESERLLRHIVVGRKAWTFRGSFEGLERGCVLWSLMMSCRMHGIDPRKYLLDTLEAFDSTPRRRLLELTPRAYAERLRAAALARAA